MSQDRVLGVNVWHQDVYYPAGSTPPVEVAERLGDHVWAQPAAADPVGLDGGVQAVPALLPPMEEHVTLSEPEPKAPAMGSLGGGGEVGPPPLSGPGSSAEAWRAYAAAHGVDVGENAKRPEVLEALRVAGVPAGD